MWDSPLMTTKNGKKCGREREGQQTLTNVRHRYNYSSIAIEYKHTGSKLRHK